MDEEHRNQDAHNLDTVLEALARARSARQEADSACLSREQLEALRAHSLSADDEAKVVQHLAACGVCRDHLVSLDAGVPHLSPAVQRRVLRSFRPKHRRWAWAGTSAGALVTAVVLFVIRPFVPAGGGLPLYALALGGGVKETRGRALHENSLPTYYPTSTLVLMARPVQGEASRPPKVAVYLETSDGTFERVRVDPTVTVASDGLVEAKVRVGEVLGRQFGKHKIRMLLTPAGIPIPDRLGEVDVNEGTRVLEGVFEYRPPEGD